MAELSLEALGSDDTARDLYVSLRVGDAQKLVKAAALAPKRSFKFAEKVVAGRKCGRIEVLRRVASCSFSLSSLLGAPQDLFLPRDDSDSSMRLRVIVGDQNLTGEKLPALQTQTPQDFKGEFMAGARAYLEAHSLEARLADAMQALLRERPKDPAAFFFEELKRSANVLRPSSTVAAASPSGPASPSGYPTATKLDANASKILPTVDTGAAVTASTAAPAQGPTAPEPLVEELRRKAVACAQNGATTLQPQPEAEQSRLQARSILLENFRTGALTEAVARKPDAVRSEAQQILAEGLASGRLAEALRASASTADVQALPAQPEDRGDSRSEARQLLEDGLRSGHLAEALTEVCSQPADASTLQRSQQSMVNDPVDRARGALLAAHEANSLDDIFAGIKPKAGSVHEVVGAFLQTEPALDVRAECQNALEKSLATGLLDDVLRDISRRQESAAASPQAAEEATRALLESCAAGQLELVIEEILSGDNPVGVAGPFVSDEARSAARATVEALAAASNDGRLDNVLKEVQRMF